MRHVYLYRNFLSQLSVSDRSSHFVMREMASHRVARFFFHQWRFGLRAQLGGARTTIAKTATAGQIEWIRHYAGDGIEPLFLRAAGSRQ